MSGCNFEGIFISPFADFTGVNIKGTKFGTDDNPLTYDDFNLSFKNAIYDETTTYNGIPISNFLHIENDIEPNHIPQ